MTTVQGAFNAAQKAFLDANGAVRDAVDFRDAEISEASRLATARIMEAHEPKISELRAIEVCADKARQHAAVALGQATLEALGDPKREQWDLTGDYWSSPQNRKWVRTGRTGTLVVYAYDAGMQRNYTQVGEIVLRINKKDGTPGAKFERMGIGGADPWGWHPVGWKPCS